MRLARMAASLMRRRLSLSSAERSSWLMIWAKARMPPSGLLISWATPPASWPSADIFSAWKRRRVTSRSCGDVLVDDDQRVAPEREGAHQPGPVAERDDPLRRLGQVLARAGQVAERVVACSAGREARPGRRRRGGRTTTLARTTSQPPRMMASGSPMASKQVRHSWAACRSASVRASSLASSSRLSRSSSACRAVSEALEPLVLLGHPELVDGVLDREEEVALVPRLPDEAEDLGAVDRLLDGGGVGLAGEEHALGGRVALLHEAEELHAVHAGHAVVGDHDVHRLARQDLERRGGLGRLQHRQAVRRSTRRRERRTCSSSSTTRTAASRERATVGWRMSVMFSMAAPVRVCTTRSRSQAPVGREIPGY